MTGTNNPIKDRFYIAYGSNLNLEVRAVQQQMQWVYRYMGSEQQKDRRLK